MGHPTQLENSRHECAACAGLRYTSIHSPYFSDELYLPANNTASRPAKADNKSQPVQSFKSIHCSVLNGVLPLSTMVHSLLSFLQSSLCSVHYRATYSPQLQLNSLSGLESDRASHTAQLSTVQQHCISSWFTVITRLILVNRDFPLEVDCHLTWLLCSTLHKPSTFDRNAVTGTGWYWNYDCSSFAASTTHIRDLHILTRQLYGWISH